MEKNVVIVLINYNQPQLTIECINSIRNSSYSNYTIVVIDNNSTDNSIDILKKEDIILIAEKDNKGFGYGCNVGMKYAIDNNADYVLLLNNDTVIDKDMITNLIPSEKNMICVPKMYYYDSKDTIWYAGGTISWNKCKEVHFGINCKDSEKYNQEKYVDFATGCCMMIPVDVIKKVGLFDENYFMYYEDIDYSIILKRYNVKIKYIPNAKLWHKVGASSKNKSAFSIYYCNRNRFYIMKKYKFGVAAWIYTYITRVVRLLVGIIKNSNDKLIYTAWKDYKESKMGRVEYERK